MTTKTMTLDLWEFLDAVMTGRKTEFLADLDTEAAEVQQHVTPDPTKGLHSVTNLDDWRTR